MLPQMSQTSPRAWFGLAAARAEHLAVAVRIGNQRGAAVAARLAQVVQPLQLAALALPVADRVLDELERGVLAEVADREDRLEHRLQAGVLALARQTVHLQEALVGLLLDLDQVRDRNGRLDFRKIDALAVDVLGKAVHTSDLEEDRSARRRTRSPGESADGETARPDGSGLRGRDVQLGTRGRERRIALLDLDLRADFFELLLDGRGLVLR